MTTISGKSMEGFRESLFRNFQIRTLAHMKRCFPEKCAELEDAMLEELIHYASQRASDYGFVNEREVCKFVDLALLFGRDFDRDPSLDWAQGILLDPDFELATERADELYDQGIACYG
jgi:hypothetical protein